jgi:hypothetical protein
VLGFFIAGLLILSCALSASITWELNASRWRPAFSSHLLLMYGPPLGCKRKMKMTMLVCANVSGLVSKKLRASMECAALPSYLL